METKPKMKFIIGRDEMNCWGNNFSVRIGAKMRDDRYAIAQPVQFEVPKEDAMMSSPALMLSRDDLQSLMDELWHVGVRPSEGSGSAGSLAATERHLADMRALVFKQKP